jgi:hypothetical protein
MEDALMRTIAQLDGTPFPSAARLASRWLRGRLPAVSQGTRDARRPNWYDAGRFWSGDDLRLSAGARLGGEIAVQIPAARHSSGMPD